MRPTSIPPPFVEIPFITLTYPNHLYPIPLRRDSFNLPDLYDPPVSRLFGFFGFRRFLFLVVVVIDGADGADGAVAAIRGSSAVVVVGSIVVIVVGGGVIVVGVGRRGRGRVGVLFHVMDDCESKVRYVFRCAVMRG